LTQLETYRNIPCAKPELSAAEEARRALSMFLAAGLAFGLKLTTQNAKLPARQTSSCRILSARSISSRRNSFSLSGASSGFPVGLTIPPEAMARSEPTSFATGIIVQICATGISSRSISLLIAAPQRVLEPHVEVRMTPCTPAAFKRAAICLPMLVEFSTAAWAPPVACMTS
jgi:hypothetical protein